MTTVTMNQDQTREALGTPIVDFSFTKYYDAEKITRYMSMQYGAMRIRMVISDSAFQTMLESFVTGKGEVSLPVDYFQELELPNPTRKSFLNINEETFKPRRFKFNNNLQVSE